MMAQIKPILACVSTAGLCAVLIIILDTFTGVPFNYAVPLALILSLMPYAFWLRARHSTAVLSTEARTYYESDDEQLSEPAPESGRSGRRSPRVSKRPATIHSIIFTPVMSGEARRDRSTQEI